MNKIKKHEGFTLIELLIAVTIIGVIAAVAIPNYQRYVSRANRVDATTELMRIAAEQEKFYLQNNSYATEPLLAPFISNVSGDITLLTQNDYYDIDVRGDAGAVTVAAYQAGFVVRATASNTGPQFLADPVCRTFQIDEAGQRTSLDDGGNDSTAECW